MLKFVCGNIVVGKNGNVAATPFTQRINKTEPYPDMPNDNVKSDIDTNVVNAGSDPNLNPSAMPYSVDGAGFRRNRMQNPKANKFISLKL